MAQGVFILFSLQYLSLPKMKKVGELIKTYFLRIKLDESPASILTIYIHKSLTESLGSSCS